MPDKKRPTPKRWDKEIKHGGKTFTVPKIKSVKKSVQVEHSFPVELEEARKIFEQTKHTKRPRNFGIKKVTRNVRILEFDILSDVWPTPDPSCSFDLAMIFEEIATVWGEDYVDKNGVLMMPPLELLNEWDVKGDDDITTESQRYLLLFPEDKIAADARIQGMRFGNILTQEDFYYLVEFILNEHQVVPED